ncbi:SDR family NAD(P)-dependent oxidoreductase [Sphingomonas sp. HDW15A]|uniref:SDR family NAD(P)-dependent oxidoreductase n=1 Tax=Sphingomonas sp. HDW15A TaxID=2714942 RepID=UPI00140C6C1F|nr:SDR family NAD(P)-dependent oxidoreductase [Sphingomonas sp. HDW15A]QIK96670.1 SDR family NAD(P)-dependent oxidoreductase [Sphingomonas sp. HDW15A]
MSQAEPERRPPRAIVIGSSGGVGSALARELTARGFDVTGLSRSAGAGEECLAIDLTRESAIEAAAMRLREKAPFAAILISTGLLHDSDVTPEKSLREMDQASLMRLFAVNAVGPALVAKHFVPLLPRQERCVFAVLSARVGSIGDNRLGGWYGYRASKAALNMIIKTLAIELSRTHPEAICVGLHPGTVDTRLSKPFQKGVPAGRLFSAEESASHLLNVIGQLTSLHTGRCFAWDGTEIVP